jgi:hypothetical protein
MSAATSIESVEGITPDQQASSPKLPLLKLQKSLI